MPDDELDVHTSSPSTRKMVAGSFAKTIDFDALMTVTWNLSSAELGWAAWLCNR
ncbi:hypothetical protein LOC71_20335 [Rhodopirellula sp. JC740]|uniref:Uncharacterized protein n=1 Tax=Rhodopirellula halodulae TaxID=2894198 RepID=A0ABS8NM21_9BACT|nr:hypothetical protein [Rhodopirellula sp. JC740]MCC9644629.1 hypothetical protein [Rhodopirellula sp. JC740]